MPLLPYLDAVDGRESYLVYWINLEPLTTRARVEWCIHSSNGVPSSPTQRNSIVRRPLTLSQKLGLRVVFSRPSLTYFWHSARERPLTQRPTVIHQVAKHVFRTVPIRLAAGEGERLWLREYEEPDRRGFDDWIPIGLILI